jgi:hypothetical protein
MNCWEEVGFGVFPVLAGLPQASSARWPRIWRSLGAETMGSSAQTEVLPNLQPALQTELISVSADARPNSRDRAVASNKSMIATGSAVDQSTATAIDRDTTAKFEGISNAALT